MSWEGPELISLYGHTESPATHGQTPSKRNPETS